MRTATSAKYGAPKRRSASPAASSAPATCRAWAADSSATSRRPCRSDRGQVGGGGQRAERLVGADVARRLLAADVLLARLQGEHVPLAALRVAGGSHQAAGHLPHRRHARRHEADVRPAEGDRDAERLALGGHDVGAVRARRLEQGQRGRLDHRDQLRAGRHGRHRPARASARARRRSSAAGRSSRRPRRAPRPRRDRSSPRRPRPGRPGPRRSRCPGRSSRWPARGGSRGSRRSRWRPASGASGGMPSAPPRRWRWRRRSGWRWRPPSRSARR